MSRGYSRALTGPRIAVGLVAALVLASVAVVVDSSVPNGHRIGGPIAAGADRGRIESLAGRTDPTDGLVPLESIALESAPVDVASDAGNSNLYFLGLNDNISVVDAPSGALTSVVPLPAGPSWAWPTGEAYVPDAGLLYVAQMTSGLCTGCGGPIVSAVNVSSDTVVADNSSLRGIDNYTTVDCLGSIPDSARVYACDSSGALIVYSGQNDTILGEVGVGSAPSAVTFDPDDSDLYVTDWGSDNVTVIDASSDEVLGSIPVGSEPDAIAFDGATGYLYVANNGSDNVSVVDGATNLVQESIPVGSGPDAVTYDSADSEVYVANGFGDNLTAISGSNNSISGSIPAGAGPYVMYYDSTNQKLYVGNESSSNVSVFATTVAPAAYDVWLTEGGLPSGTEWFVNVTGAAPESSTGASLAVAEPNGTYDYSVATVDKEFSGVGGSFVVGGRNLSVPVDFSRVTYGVTFEETGLPSGTTWTVTVGGVGESASATSLVFDETNGSYSFAVGAVPGYAGSNQTGNVSVRGVGVVERVSFRSTATSSSAHGLPPIEGYALVVGGVAVVAAGAIVVLLARHRARAVGLSPHAPGGRARIVAVGRLRGPSTPTRI